jgi:parallel beta-helix repeat protein
MTYARGFFGVALAVGLWTLTVGTALAQPPVPPEMKQWVKANKKGGYDLFPTGVDDSDHAQWTLDNADVDGLIRFRSGPNGETDFYLSRGLSRFNWVGTIRGEGMEVTVLHTLEGYDATMPFEFYYDRRLGYGWSGQGRLQLSDFKLVVDGPTATWINHGVPSNEVPGVVFVLDFYLVDLFFGGSPPPWPDLGVDLSFERIWAVGEPRQGEGYPWGRTLLWPIDVEFIQGGSHRIHQVRQDTTHFIYLRPMFNADWEISELEVISPQGWGVTYRCLGCETTISELEATNVPPWASTVYYQCEDGCETTVSDCTTTDASLIAVMGNPNLLPSVHRLNDNRIDPPPGAQWGGIEIWEGFGGSQYELSSNVVLAEPDGWPALFAAQVDDALFEENLILYDAASPANCLVPPCGGIKLLGGSAELKENTISGSPFDGITVVGSEATLKQNTVSGSVGAGVSVVEYIDEANGESLPSTAVLEENELQGNDGGEVYVDPASTVIWVD